MLILLRQQCPYFLFVPGPTVMCDNERVFACFLFPTAVEGSKQLGVLSHQDFRISSYPLAALHITIPILANIYRVAVVLFIMQCIAVRVAETPKKSNVALSLLFRHNYAEARVPRQGRRCCLLLPDTRGHGAARPSRKRRCYPLHAPRFVVDQEQVRPVCMQRVPSNRHHPPPTTTSGYIVAKTPCPPIPPERRLNSLVLCSSVRFWPVNSEHVQRTHVNLLFFHFLLGYGY